MPEEFMKKDFAVDIKAVEGERALNWTITTTKKDRAGDIVEAKGVKLANFKKNPVVLLAHDYKGLAIAKAEKLEKTDEKIVAKVVFPPEGDYPLADTVYKLYKGKFMRACSIGFIPIKSEDIVDEDDKDKDKESYRTTGRRIKTWELIEFSACAIGMNPDALDNQKMMTKGIDIEPLKEAGFIEIEGEKEEEELEADNEKIEETEDFIRIPAKGEEGKHKGHKIRWITVSEKEGIRGIYCIDCKKIISFVFDKKKGWTLEKAKKWMAEHGKSISDYFEKFDGDIDYTVEEVDWEKIEANILREEFKDYPKFKYFDEEGNETEIENEGYKDFEAMALRFCEKYLSYRKRFEELKEKLKDIELKAGAVLNAKNKTNLKNAQNLIQEVLDSAETNEDSLEIEDEKDSKDDNTVIDLEDGKGDDEKKDEEKDEDKIEVDEKVIAETITKKMNYLVGKLDKSNT